MAVITGNDLANTLIGTANADVINGLGGNDTLNAKSRPAGGGTDVIDGGDDIDTLVVNASSETKGVLVALSGVPASYYVRSDSGNFWVDTVNIEKVKVTGGSGNDTFDTGSGGVEVVGGGGIDHWIADLGALTTAVDYKLGATGAIAAAGLTTILGIERISLKTGSGGDTITGGAQGDAIITGAGNDTVNARTRPVGGGTDFIDAGADIDTLVVDASAETKAVFMALSGVPASYFVRSDSGNLWVDTVNVEKVRFTGGAGNDTFDTANGGLTVDGGGGIDHWIVDLQALTTSVVFTLGQTKTIAADGLTSILNIERITLTTGSANDTITGGAEGDSIRTGLGNDTINARTRPVSGAVDFVDAGDGIDTLIVDASAETMNMFVALAGVPASYYVRSDSGNFWVDTINVEKVRVTGGAGNDTFDTGRGGSRIDGGGGIDHWIGDLGALVTVVDFTLGETTSIAAAGLGSILNIERVTLTTGSASDIITTGDQADQLYTGKGNDTINLGMRPPGGGADFADAGAGTDTLVVDASNETGAVSLALSGVPASYYVRSQSGKFWVDTVNVEKVRITGGAGDDTFDTGKGGIEVHGGGGIDHWIANLGALTTNVSFKLGETTAIAAAGLTSILDIERITLTTGTGADTIIGGAQADVIVTGANNDTINAMARPSGGSADFVDGGTGTDTLVVDASAEATGIFLSLAGVPASYYVRSDSGNFWVDTINVEKVKVTGGAGNDTFDTGKGGIQVHGGGGNDHWIADLGHLTSAVTFKIAETKAIAAAGLSSIKDIERISLTTGSGADTITGGAIGDVIISGGGNDTIDAGARAAGGAIDFVDGGTGSDTLVVDASAETQAVLLGLSGVPASFYVRSDSGNVWVDTIGMESVVFTGGAGNDTATGGNSADTLRGGLGNDFLDGGIGADMMIGDGGDDTYIVGNPGDIVTEAAGAGSDTVRTTLTAYALGDNLENLTFIGAGNFTGRGNGLANTMIGGAGNDTLTGGTGADTLTGGSAADVFRFGAVADSALDAADIIRDFSVPDGDILDLSAIDAVSGVAGNQAFVFVGSATFSGAKGEIRAEVMGDGKTHVFGTTIGGTADIEIMLNGNHALVAGSFKL